MTYTVAAAVVALGALSSDAVGQQAEGQERVAPPGQVASTITLVYEREVFTYQGMGRRDPFRPLTDADEMGPRFEQLTLQGIIYSTGTGRSVAMLADGDGRIFRVRVGDVVGNSRVVDIGPLRVVLAVENFGNVRQEMLELTRTGGTDQ